MSSFDDPAAVASYAANPPRLVPGFHDMQRMTQLLLAERVGRDADILVLGAGGGLEIKAFADAQPGWNFAAIDPSGEMIALGQRNLAEHAARVHWTKGYIFDAPTTPRDAATCILTMHFVPPDQKIATLAAIRARLKPGAPFVMAHHSYPQDPADRAKWLSRFAAFAVSTGGMLPERAGQAARDIAEKLPAASPEQDQENLRAAGFTGIELFYAAFSFRGWVATA